MFLTDVTNDHRERHLEAGLPAYLEFQFKRSSDDVILRLHENTRLNQNAPMFTTADDKNGERRLVQIEDSQPLHVRHYYLEMS